MIGLETWGSGKEIMSEAKLQTLALIGSYVPRQCGIATFTKDLYDGLAAGGGTNACVLAIDDNEEGYPYPPEVRFELRAGHLRDYELATDFLNINQIDVLVLQHEYGLFGARAGENVLVLVKNTRMPVITTLHTVLREPNDEQAAVMKELIRHSDGIVVMSNRGREILAERYGAPLEKVQVIPHGIPDVPFVDPAFYKDRFGFQGRRVLMTFGLLSPGKGLEVVIRSLPAIVRRFPELIYVIVGAVHPHVRKREGNAYVAFLQRLAQEAGVADNVVFHTRYVSLEELCAYLGAADIFVTPYPNREQIVSGTLTYAMGAGKAVVSTPYAYAQEMLAEGRGRLFPFNDSDALAAVVIELLEDQLGTDAMRKQAYLFCRPMVWRNVAERYRELAVRTLAQRLAQPRPAPPPAPAPRRVSDLPEIRLDHLLSMTDDTGLLQHAIYSVPDRRHGYCTDDNARALVAMMLHWDLTEEERVIPLAGKYLSFLHYAYDPQTKRFRNFFSFDRHWIRPDELSDDAYGRSMWGLGMTVAIGPNEGLRALATRLFGEALAGAEGLGSPRAWAMTLMGIHAYLRRFSGDAFVRRARECLARRLLDRFVQGASEDWPWYESTVTYSNGKLPLALILSGQWLPDAQMVQRGLAVLDWLIRVQTDEHGRLSLIGNNGWFTRGSTPARFDQQPVDAMALILACAEAWRCTRDERWRRRALWAFEWFLGRNVTSERLYDPTTGGCRDGLHVNGPNLNEGAESTLAWLISLMTLHQLQREKSTGVPASPPAHGERMTAPLSV
jgi:glycosyltransferase involved in cell wall biosynthesis